jgi:transglutaminase-like putative cysteine protease
MGQVGGVLGHRLFYGNHAASLPSAQQPMQIAIEHRLSYEYERPVFLEPHSLRLSPRQNSSQRLISHGLEISPSPTGCCNVLEPDGSDGQVFWFNDPCDHLEIRVCSELETLRSNPYDWILTETTGQTLPFPYEPSLAASLQPYLVSLASDAVTAWAAAQAAVVAGATAAFPQQLADEIHHNFEHGSRPEGEPFSPHDTLSQRSGACRDMAMLFIAACRSQGLAARFVSGYSIHHPPEVTEQELHAWAEVYLPGGGWRGYDPSLGLAVADGHVALVSAPDHRLAAPVSGSYRGTGVQARLSYQVIISSTEVQQQQAMG